MGVEYYKNQMKAKDLIKKYCKDGTNLRWLEFVITETVPVSKKFVRDYIGDLLDLGFVEVDDEGNIKWVEGKDEVKSEDEAQGQT